MECSSRYLIWLNWTKPLSLSKEEVKEKRRVIQHRPSLFFLFYEVSHYSRSHLVSIRSYHNALPTATTSFYQLQHKRNYKYEDFKDD